MHKSARNCFSVGDDKVSDSKKRLIKNIQYLEREVHKDNRGQNRHYPVISARRTFSNIYKGTSFDLEHGLYKKAFS